MQINSLISKIYNNLLFNLQTIMKRVSEYIKWVIGKIYSCIVIPLTTFWGRRNLVRSILWMLFSVGLSLVGTIINVIKIAFFDISIDNPKVNFMKEVAYSIYLDSRSGTFYTFSIVMAASTLYPLFEGFVKHNFHYLNLRVLAIIAALLLLSFGGVFYSFSSIDSQDVVCIDNFEPCVDIYQLSFFLFAIFISSYSFSLGLMMDEHENNPHPEIDDYDYVKKEENDIDKMKQGVGTTVYINNLKV